MIHNMHVSTLSAITHFCSHYNDYIHLAHYTEFHIYKNIRNISTDCSGIFRFLIKMRKCYKHGFDAGLYGE